MEVQVTGHIPVTGDCGHKFDVPITGMEDDFACPECGHVDRFTPEQIAGFKAEITKAAGAHVTDEVRKIWNESLRKSTAGNKHIKYRPG
ncbi:hypothetical protein ASE67_02525 [Sphingomonas sp. Leaf23]|uniref:hypothetical protein n=1 Tax=Sphingomonas sp. Leaf23 TaxID=1735689 RepID=UPI0006F9E2F4|nr:hypothetical protein [Sphingomonas sp. Leaf23]KQM88635.1 hypothetical protein ASE67_02525 [Sphingomonas sp. Leaf23]